MHSERMKLVLWSQMPFQVFREKSFIKDKNTNGWKQVHNEGPLTFDFNWSSLQGNGLTDSLSKPLEEFQPENGQITLRISNEPQAMRVLTVEKMSIDEVPKEFSLTGRAIETGLEGLVSLVNRFTQKYWLQAAVAMARNNEEPTLVYVFNGNGEAVEANFHVSPVKDYDPTEWESEWAYENEKTAPYIGHRPFLRFNLFCDFFRNVSITHNTNSSFVFHFNLKKQQ